MEEDDIMLHMKNRIVFKIVLSAAIAVCVVVCLYLVYDYAANLLNKAIDNHSIAFIEGFNLKEKLYEKCGFESFPSASLVQNMFGLFYKLFLFWVVFVGLLFFAPWSKWSANETVSFFPKTDCIIPHYSGNKSSLIALLVSVILLFLFWHWIISLSGMLGDDYYCGMTQGKPFITRFAWWMWCYATHVSRIGEAIYYIFPQTIDRTYHLIVTPMFVALFPFVMKRFSHANFSMAEWRGVAFYWMMGLMCFMGVIIIRIFIVFAPTANYFYPVVTCLFFWSFYYRYEGYNQNNNYSTIAKILFFILGVFSGWATEGLGVVGILLATLWLFYWYRRERHISKMHYVGLIAYFIGACSVVFSTGPIIRGLRDTSLTGGNVPYNLSVLPLCQRFTYIPEMIEAIWPCIRFSVMFIALIVILALIFRLKSCYSKQVLLRLLSFSIVAFALCFVYIVGAIPNGSTFSPASFLMIAALGGVFAKLLESNWKVAIFPLAILMICTFVYMKPRIQHALLTSKAEKERISNILEAKHKGVKDLVLPYPADFDLSRTTSGEEVDRTYIPFQHFSSDPKDNTKQAMFFGLNSIAEEDWK